MIMTHMT